MIIHPKNGVSTAVLAPREGQIGRIVDGLSTNWTEVRIGMYLTGVDAHDENIAGHTELVSVSDSSDYVTFGLKNSSSKDLPGQSGSLFIGVRSNGLTSKSLTSSSGIGWFADSSEECAAVGYAGVTAINGGVLGGSSMSFPNSELASGYNGFYCVKFVINAMGTSSQSVSISIAKTPSIPGTDYSKQALYQLINNSVFGVAKTVAWNTGVSARDIPDSVWIRVPFFNTRIRIQEMLAIQILP